jgi:hypothetical protein
MVVRHDLAAAGQRRDPERGLPSAPPGAAAAFRPARASRVSACLVEMHSLLATRRGHDRTGMSKERR